MKWRRPSADRVTPELVAALRARDRGCVLARIDPEHGCRDAWGTPHASTDLDRLTVEHVKTEPRMGKRAPSDLAHTLLLCAAANVGVPSKVERVAFREYLRRVNEEAA